MTLSVKPERPVDAVVIDVLRAVDAAARELATPTTVLRLRQSLEPDRVRNDLAIDMARDLVHLDDPVATAHRLLIDFIAGLTSSR